MDPLDQLDLVVPNIGTVVRGVKPDQLDDPVPGMTFTVRELLGHFLGNLDSVTRSFGGEPITDLAPRPEIIGDDAGAAYDSVLGEFASAFRQPGAMNSTISLPPPFGDVPAEAFMRFVVFDLIIHAWELARATGQTYTPPDEILPEVDGFVRQLIAPELRDGDIFAAEVPAPDDATPFERIVAFSGREPRAA